LACSYFFDRYLRLGCAEGKHRESCKTTSCLADDVIEVSENALAKADKLDVEEPLGKKIIRSIAIIPPVAAPKAKATKIISRHWQNGYAKAKTRKHYVSRKKHQQG
jgi:hypothetical protein